MAGHTKLRALDGAVVTLAESKLLAAYRAADDVARGDIVSVARAIADASPRQRVVLTLVAGGRGRPVPDGARRAGG